MIFTFPPNALAIFTAGKSTKDLWNCYPFGCVGEHFFCFKMATEKNVHCLWCGCHCVNFRVFGGVIGFFFRGNAKNFSWVVFVFKEFDSSSIFILELFLGSVGAIAKRF